MSGYPVAMHGFAATPRAGRLFVVALLAVVLAGCAMPGYDTTARDVHVVRRGETLYTIAWRYGRDHRDLARWNRLGDGSLIFPGQVIRLRPPSGGTTSAPGRRETPRPLPPVPAGPAPAWQWPAAGPVEVEFGRRPGAGTGLLVGGRRGQPVHAAADGRVVYAGGGLIGYGKLIILKHNDTYLSAYGHNASLLVTEGQSIRKGQRIATMGEGPGQEPRLHFEIRRNGQPVDPRRYLPAR